MQKEITLATLVTSNFIMSLNVLNIEMWNVHFELYYCAPGLSDIGYN